LDIAIHYTFIKTRHYWETYFLVSDNRTFILALQSSYKDFIEEAQAAAASGYAKARRIYPEKKITTIWNTINIIFEHDFMKR